LRDVDLYSGGKTPDILALLNHFAIEAKLFSIHDHNEKDKAGYVASLLDEGKNVALVSDAGTPLISDPGYHVVHALRGKGHKVVLFQVRVLWCLRCARQGLPTDQFFFAGFVPAKSKGRCDLFESWKKQTGTVVFYESTHRIYDSIADVQKSLR